MRTFVVPFLAAVGLLVSLGGEAFETPSQPDDPVVYERDVEPILRERCFRCHGARRPKAGLRLDQRKLALGGG